jgi:hypothetical protein
VLVLELVDVWVLGKESLWDEKLVLEWVHVWVKGLVLEKGIVWALQKGNEKEHSLEQQLVCRLVLVWELLKELR